MSAQLRFIPDQPPLECRPSTVCNVCYKCLRQLDTEWTETKKCSPVLTHHESLESFQKAISKPCLICNHLQFMWSTDAVSSDLSTTCRCDAIKDEGLRLNFDLRGQEPVLVYLRFTDDEQTSSRYNEQLVPVQTSDDRVLKKARAWLEYCHANHPICAKHNSKRKYYPQRLVDLLPEAHPNGSHWSLVEDTDGLTNGYATLSHRWGEDDLEPFKLLQSTRNDMLKGLPDSCLSGTYQDAIRVSRELGLRYVWIDSLCIPQDPGTLNIQVAAYQMAEIYGRSSCNIATLTARQDTIFAEREPLLHSPAATALPASIYGLQNSYTVLLAKVWDRCVLDTPLSRRAWILQEQLLPKRLLYFGEGQLLWSCLEGAFCELYPLDGLTCSWLGEGMFEGDVGSLRSCISYAARFSAKSSDKGQTDDTDDTDDEIRHVPEVPWMDLLTLYGQRHLKYAEDKLLAIAGFSQLLTSIRNDDLIGGLVTSELPENLLWNMSHASAKIGGYGEIRRSPVHRAPSWSWAYYDGPISEYEGPVQSYVRRKRAVARVTKIETDITVADDVKIVKGGDMHLLAASLALERCSLDLEGPDSAEDCWLLSFSSLPQSSQCAEAVKGLKLSCFSADSTEQETWTNDFDGTVLFDVVNYSSLSEPLTAVFITRSEPYLQGASKSQMYRYDGLVLRQHPVRGKGVYERVGLFVIACHSESLRGPDLPMNRLWRFSEFVMGNGLDAKMSSESDVETSKFMRNFIIG